jgi:hypothetical protein
LERAASSGTIRQTSVAATADKNGGLIYDS